MKWKRNKEVDEETRNEVRRCQGEARLWSRVRIEEVEEK